MSRMQTTDQWTADNCKIKQCKELDSEMGSSLCAKQRSITEFMSSRVQLLCPRHLGREC